MTSWLLSGNYGCHSQHRSPEVTPVENTLHWRHSERWYIILKIYLKVIIPKQNSCFWSLIHVFINKCCSIIIDGEEKKTKLCSPIWIENYWLIYYWLIYLVLLCIRTSYPGYPPWGACCTFNKLCCILIRGTIKCELKVLYTIINFSVYQLSYQNMQEFETYIIRPNTDSHWIFK